MFRRAILLSLGVLALAFTATALADGGNGFKVWGTAQHRPATGSEYTVLSHGVAKQKALLSVYLDRRPCLAAWKNEAKRFTSSKAPSHFRDSGKAFTTMSVSGHFSKAFVAIAGTTAETEYACSYLTTANSQGSYTVTVARRSSTYFVTG